MVHQLNEELVKNYQKIMVSCGLVLEELASDPLNNIVLPGTRQSNRRYRLNRVNKTGSYSLVNKNRSRVLPVPPIVSLDASINQFQNVLDLMFVELEDSIDFLKAEEKRLSTLSTDVIIPKKEHEKNSAVNAEGEKLSLKETNRHSNEIAQKIEKESNKASNSNNDNTDLKAIVSGPDEIKIEKDSRGDLLESVTVASATSTNGMSSIDSTSSTKEKKENIADDSKKDNVGTGDTDESKSNGEKQSREQEVKENTETNASSHLTDEFDVLIPQEETKIITPAESNTNSSISDNNNKNINLDHTSNTFDDNSNKNSSNDNENNSNNNIGNSNGFNEFDINNFGGQDIQITGEKNNLTHNLNSTDATMDFDGLNFDFPVDQSVNTNGNENNETGEDINNLLDMLQGIIQEKPDN